MKVPDFIKDTLVAALRTGVIWFVKKWLGKPEVNKAVYDGCKFGATWVTDNCKKSIGDAWEPIEEQIQELLDTASEGVNAGLDSDDKAV